MEEDGSDRAYSFESFMAEYGPAISMLREFGYREDLPEQIDISKINDKDAQGNYINGNYIIQILIIL